MEKAIYNMKKTPAHAVLVRHIQQLSEIRCELCNGFGHGWKSCGTLKDLQRWNVTTSQREVLDELVKRTRNPLRYAMPKREVKVYGPSGVVTRAQKRKNREFGSSAQKPTPSRDPSAGKFQFINTM